MPQIIAFVVGVVVVLYFVSEVFWWLSSTLGHPVILVALLGLVGAFIGGLKGNDVSTVSTDGHAQKSFGPFVSGLVISGLSIVIFGQIMAG